MNFKSGQTKSSGGSLYAQFKSNKAKPSVVKFGTTIFDNCGCSEKSTDKGKIVNDDEMMENGGPGSGRHPIGTESSGIETNGKLIAEATGGNHTASSRGLSGNRIYHAISHDQPGKAAVDAHAILSDEDASAGVGSVQNPVPHHNGWRVSADMHDGSRQHFTFYPKV